MVVIFTFTLITKNVHYGQNGISNREGIVFASQLHGSFCSSDVPP